MILLNVLTLNTSLSDTTAFWNPLFPMACAIPQAFHCVQKGLKVAGWGETSPRFLVQYHGVYNWETVSVQGTNVQNSFRELINGTWLISFSSVISDVVMNYLSSLVNE